MAMLPKRVDRHVCKGNVVVWTQVFKHLMAAEAADVLAPSPASKAGRRASMAGSERGTPTPRARGRGRGSAGKGRGSSRGQGRGRGRKRARVESTSEEEEEEWASP